VRELGLEMLEKKGYTALSPSAWKGSPESLRRGGWVPHPFGGCCRVSQAGPTILSLKGSTLMNQDKPEKAGLHAASPPPSA
jgi:hypothetical protein